MAETLFMGVISGAVFGVFVGIVVFVIRIGRFAKEKITENKEEIINTATGTAKKLGASANSAYRSSLEIVNKISDGDSDIDEKYFEAAYEEYKNGEIRKALWIKELSLVNQDAVKAESNYIKKRARELRDSDK